MLFVLPEVWGRRFQILMRFATSHSAEVPDLSTLLADSLLQRLIYSPGHCLMRVSERFTGSVVHHAENACKCHHLVHLGAESETCMASAARFCRPCMWSSRKKDMESPLGIIAT